MHHVLLRQQRCPADYDGRPALRSRAAYRYAMTLFIPAMWAIIRFFHSAAHLTLVTSGVMAAELAAQARLCHPTS